MLQDNEALRGVRILSPYHWLKQAKADAKAQAKDAVTDFGNFLDEITKDNPQGDVARREQAAEASKEKDQRIPGFARQFLVGYTTSMRYAKSHQDGRQLPLMPHLDMGMGQPHMPHM